MRVCLKCQAFYDDDNVKFCLIDGVPLLNMDQTHGLWEKGSEAVRQTRQVVSKQIRKQKLTRIVSMTVTTIITVMVISVIALNSYVYLNPEQEEVAQDTQPKETPGITAALGPQDEPVNEPGGEPESEPEPGETPPPETDDPTSPGEAPDPRLPDEPDRSDGPKKTKPSESPTTGPTTKTLPELPCLMGSHHAADINDLMVSFRGRWREKTISDKRWAIQEGIRHYKREPQQKEYNVTVTNIIGDPDIGITITGACKASVKISSMWKVTLSHNHTLISTMNISRTNSFYCSKTKTSWSCTF